MPEDLCSRWYGRTSCFSTPQANTFTLRMFIEKARDRDHKAYIAFIYFCAAFDSVPRQEIWEALEEKKIRPNLVSTIKSMYQEKVLFIWLEQRHLLSGSIKALSKEIASALSFYNRWDAESMKNHSWLLLHDPGKGPMFCLCRWHCMMTCCRPSPERLQIAMEKWSEELLRRGLWISRSKSKVMHVGWEQ